MSIQFAVKKGDIVALVINRSATYAHGTGRGTERYKTYTLAIVNGASRDGRATSLKRVSGSIEELRRKDYDLSEVMTIKAHLQPAALKAFARLTWETDEFASSDDLKAVITKERTDEVR